MPDRVARRSARLDGLGTTVFAEMTALAQSTGAINLGQGFPDIDGPREAIEAAVSALRGGENQYAPLPGVPDLRDAVLAHQRDHYGLEPEDVLITFVAGIAESRGDAASGHAAPARVPSDRVGSGSRDHRWGRTRAGAAAQLSPQPDRAGARCAGALARRARVRDA
jgi:hypothetical protein